jgi:acyl-CoA thioesterase-1
VTEQNLARMIEMSQTQGAKVMLLGIRLPTNYGPAYDAQLARVYAGLAERYALVFDPFFLETVALEPDLMQDDALHPNQQAQPLILKRLWPLVQKLLD